MALTLLVLLAGSVWFYATQKKSLEAAAKENLNAVADLKVSQIAKWRAERLGEAAELVESSYNETALSRWMDGATPQSTEQILTLLGSYQAHGGYADILLVDTDGKARLSLREHPWPAGEQTTHALAEALHDHQAKLSDLQEDAGSPGPYLDAIAPVFAGNGNTVRPVGAVLLRCAARDFLYPLIQSWPVPSRTAETLLVRRDGDSVLYLNELRHQHHTALALRLPLSRTNLPAVAAVTGAEGAFYGKDYRDVVVVAMLRAIPGSPWFIVAKEDAAEVLASWRFRSVMILALILVLFAVAASAFVAIWQRNEKNRYRSQFESEARRRAAEERYRVTLLSVGDGVIATDAQGKVQLVNPVAESLTGWPHEDARGKPLEEVFHILNEETRLPIENPVSRVIREGLVVGLANHTLLVDRAGRERAIADSGAPIKDHDGRTIGVVLVFRDITAELRTRHERETTVDLLRLLNTQSATHELIREITGLMQRWTGCEAVGVRLKEGDDFPYFETRGFPADFVEAERYLCERDIGGQPIRDEAFNPVLQCMCGNVLRGRFDPGLPFFTAKGSFFTNSTTELLAATTEQDRQTRTRNRCNGEGYESVALIPLQSGDETLGLLQLNDRRRDRFTPELISFLERAADQIAIALAQRKSEERYRSLFQNMLNGFAYCKMLFTDGRPQDFIYLDVNDAFETLTGLKNVIGKRVSEVIPGIRESDPQLLETYGRVSLSGRPERFETYVAAMDMWFSISVYSPREEHFVAVFDVITQRKKIEAAHQLLASAVEQAAEMIVITDPAGLIQYVNPAFEAVTGYSFDEVVGSNPRILQSGEHDRDFYKDLWDTIISGNTWKGHLVNKKKDGTRYSEDASISPVRGPDDSVVNYVAVKRDSTREHHLEDQLRQAQKIESIGRLAGGVAHDFNNMLQVISSYVEISLGQTDEGNPLHRNLQQIGKAARRSAELVGQLLAFARKQTVSPRVVEINEAVGGALKMLQRLIGEDIEIAWMPGHDAGHIRIDPSQLDQVLANLAVNARDAITGVGKLTIETGRVTIDEEYRSAHPGFVAGNFVMLAVSDNGSGMARETLSHLFEPFFTTKPVGKGTGLGLATIYGIIKQNSGFINVYSEPGQGSTFRIYLPDVTGEPEGTSPGGGAREMPGGTETILVVEDEAAILEISRTLLESLGYTVLSAGTPVEALQLAAGLKNQIRLLITDVVMPQMNGLELAKRLAETNPGLKWIFMSGYTADVIAHQGILDKGVHFISKPFSMSDLAEKVREVLA